MLPPVARRAPALDVPALGARGLLLREVSGLAAEDAALVTSGRRSAVLAAGLVLQLGEAGEVGVVLPEQVHWITSTG